MKNDLFGAQKRTQGELSRLTDLDQATISRIQAGKEGFSATAAKRVAKLDGIEPASVYVESQVRAARKRWDDGEIGADTVLKVVGRIVSTLKAEFPEGQIEDEVARDLQHLAAEASKKAVPVNTYEALGRDSFGLKAEKGRNTETKTAVKSTGRAGRSGYEKMRH